MNQAFQAFSFKSAVSNQQNKRKSPTSCRTPSTSSRSEINNTKEKTLNDYREIITQAKSFINLVSHRQKLRDLLKKTKKTAKSPSLFLLRPSSDMNEFPTLKKSKKNSRSISVLARNKCKLVLENKKPSEEYRKSGISWVHYQPIAKHNETPHNRARSVHLKTTIINEKTRRSPSPEQIAKKTASIIFNSRPISNNEIKRALSNPRQNKECLKTDNIDSEIEESDYIKTLLIPTYSKYEYDNTEDDSPTSGFKPRY
ncbi:unnamed protein product [Blepharisma stoltei]|uniref:Uncharacterized protein n=1 Tax=Blepharisma stoltei TaxID=1481888 RepID=A0AAU9JK12_9CILI|nr:unnamed protein product [Blepharisma stoltei]